MWIDAHCHLEDDAFGDDLDAVIARAYAAGVQAMVTAGADLASSRAALAIAEKYDRVYAAVGIHPENAETCDEAALAELRTLARHPKVVAIGEIGLDFHYADGAPHAAQELALTAQLDLAQDLGKPVVLHDRDAHAELMELLQRREGRPGGMLHCFSGGSVMARQAIDLGFYISVAGNITFPNARTLREVVRALPLGHILVETDAPYLAPQPRRGRRNEPAFVALTGAHLAELLNLDLAVLQETVRQNSRALFGWQTVE